MVVVVVSVVECAHANSTVHFINCDALSGRTPDGPQIERRSTRCRCRCRCRCAQDLQWSSMSESQSESESQ